ncbi:MAG: glutamate-1-semialdehyde 2,1-aminomutase [Steroidobacteraceae bacterium]
MSDSQRSEELFARAQRVMPGGVSSPVRAFRAVGGTPRVIASGAGARLRDVDGREYVDFVCSWGALPLGHAPREIVKAIGTASAQGTTFGAPCVQEIELAETIIEAYPAVEQVRFVSSGTEATMSAIRLARAATRRDVVVKFAGCYHGHADHLLVAAGSGGATFGQPSSAGVPGDFTRLTRVLPLDDEAALASLFEREGERIAAVIIEPIPANHGLLLQRPAFLKALRDRTRASGALLIFDEVISGFRVARGGAAQLLGIRPDLATFGKIIGGGLPVGAYGGSRELMRLLAPEGPVYQAGTLSGNPVAMSAGLAALRAMARQDAWSRLEALGGALERALSPVLGERSALTFVRCGSIFWLYLSRGPAPRASHAFADAIAERFRGLFHGLLERGIYYPPSAYEAGFLSLAHTEEDVARFARAVAESLPRSS